MAGATSTSLSPVPQARVGHTNKIRVWDPIVRLFHWTIVIGVLLNYAILAAGKPLHRYTGYAVLGALVLRLAWGFIGPGYARFSTFVVGPKAAGTYLADIAKGRNQRYIGHNPAGGMMVLALIGTLLLTCLTGWMQRLDAFWGVEWVTEVHEAFANAVVALAAVHVLGVALETWRHRENLTWSMITGRKRPPKGTDVGYAYPARRG